MDRTRSLELYKNRKKKGRWGKKKYKDNRNWAETNEMYVVSGEFFLDFDFVMNWQKELEEINKSKVGAPPFARIVYEMAGSMAPICRLSRIGGHRTKSFKTGAHTKI
ncbi:MAG: hypothetical protein KGH64_04545 [Candidatus Micrarchaeota archaeon]|nr:hypothetical protein [Candidatus Micrarchaeota archaeon]MDE1859650.1 hypothetical protein [Candidatus Micrarchaeota archaeon]